MAKKLSVAGTTEPRYFFTKSGWFCSASEIEQKITPALASSFLKVVATETLSKTASTATRFSVPFTPNSTSCSFSGMPSLAKSARISSGTSSMESYFAPAFGSA